jgi:hypothetical protein
MQDETDAVSSVGLTNDARKIVMRFDTILAQALETWPRATFNGLTDGLDFGQNTMEWYRDGEVSNFQFDVLARICWYFSVPLDTLLPVLPASADVSSLPPVILGRHAPPSGRPPIGHIRVLNFVPAEVRLRFSTIRQRTDWKQPNISSLARGHQRRVYRKTLETLLNILNYEHVSQFLDVQVNEQAPLTGTDSLVDIVRYVEPRPTWLAVHWPEVVGRWRSLGATAGEMSPEHLDLAAVRYLYQELLTHVEERDLRIGRDLAAALSKSPQWLVLVRRGEIMPAVRVHDLPRAVRQYLDAIVDADWRSTARRSSWPD